MMSGMTISDSPEPDEPESEEPLRLVRVAPAGLSDPEAVRRHQIELEFNRRLTWWEHEAASGQRVFYNEHARAFVTNLDLTHPDALNTIRNMGEQIEKLAHVKRQLVVRRVQIDEEEAESINRMLQGLSGP